MEFSALQLRPILFMTPLKCRAIKAITKLEHKPFEAALKNLEYNPRASIH